MQPEQLEHYRKVLLEMRQRVTGEVAHMVESIKEESNPTGNVSNVPVHLGDLASNAIDADVHVLEREQGILEDIETALARIQEGTYGSCESCGSPIAEERLESLPHTVVCIACASSGVNGPRWSR